MDSLQTFIKRTSDHSVTGNAIHGILFSFILRQGEKLDNMQYFQQLFYFKRVLQRSFEFQITLEFFYLVQQFASFPSNRKK